MLLLNKNVKHEFGKLTSTMNHICKCVVLALNNSLKLPDGDKNSKRFKILLLPLLYFNYILVCF